MSSPAPRRPHAEGKAIEDLVARLSAQFPHKGREDIRSLIRAEYEAYDAARIRDFIPVLVERAARTRLASGSASLAGRTD